MSHDDDLSVSLCGLTALVAARVGLEETLRSIAGYAARAVPGADGAVLTVLEDGRPSLIVASAASAGPAEEVQYAIAEGPSIAAIAERRAMVSASVGADPRWPRFGSRVARMGLHSVLAAPMVLPELVVGTVSIYARAKGAFGDREVQITQQYAKPAAAVTRNAVLRARCEVEVEQLNEALRTGRLVDQAIGIIRARTGKSANEAFASIRHRSHVEHTRMATVAGEIVDEAVRRANARRRGIA